MWQVWVWQVWFFSEGTPVKCAVVPMMTTCALCHVSAAVDSFRHNQPLSPPLLSCPLPSPPLLSSPPVCPDPEVQCVAQDHPQQSG